MKLYLYIGIVAVFASYSVGLVLWGVSVGKQSVKVNILKEVVDSEIKFKSLEKEIITLSRPDLRKRYCKWVRDDKDLCLKSNIPIP